MKLYIIIFLFIVNINAQYVFLNESITDTFYFASEIDANNKTLPDFAYPPYLKLNKNSNNAKILKLETSYFVLSKSGVYDFYLINNFHRSQPGGNIFLGEGDAMPIWFAIKHSGAYYNNKLYITWKENGGAGLGQPNPPMATIIDPKYCKVNYDTVGYIPGEINIDLGHFQSAMIYASDVDSIYMIYGVHNDVGGTQIFSGQSIGDTVGSEPLAFGITYPFLHYYSDTDSLVFTAREIFKYKTLLVSMDRTEFPDSQKIKTLTNFTATTSWSYLINSYFTGDEIFVSGYIDDVPNMASGIGTQMWCDLHFIYSPDRGQSWYNYLGSDLTAMIPITETTRDSIVVVDTDTLFTSVISTIEINDKFYIFYLLEDSSKTDSSNILNVCVIDYVNYSYENYETNLGSKSPWSCFDVYYKDNYVWLLGMIGNNQNTWQDFWGNSEIYRTSLDNLTTWTKMGDITNDALSSGGQFVLNNENMLYFMYSDECNTVLTTHGNVYLYMRR